VAGRSSAGGGISLLFGASAFGGALALATFAAAPAGAHVVGPGAAGDHPLAAASIAPAQVRGAGEITACGGKEMPSPDRAITGSFGPEAEGSYVMVPFAVPAGTDAVRVKYCHDQPQLAQVPGTDRVNKHTLDLGLYEPRTGGDGLWDVEEFRGWGGSSRPDVTVSPEGTIDPDPAPVATDKTTVGYRPGPIPAGEWAAELGVAALGEELAVEDGRVQWRIEIDFLQGPQYTDQPYQPAAYDPAPASGRTGWYAGDMHVHARHSAPGDATMRETFSYAFCPDPDLGALCDAEEAQPGAGLDFITLSDYVTDRAWGEIGAFQGDYPGKLIVRSAEVITYRGHVNNHASGRLVDYRTGPIHLRRADGSLERMRSARPASEVFRDIRAGNGWTQINHPETFPSEIPTFGNLCRGCSWEYSRAETRYSLVDAIEVATGPAGLQQDPSPGPNPFTPLAIEFYEQAIDAGGSNANHIAAVGSSDSHNAGRPDDPLTQSPIGQATTVVRADELSEDAIREGVRQGHTYVKLWGNDGPDLRLEASTGRGGSGARGGETKIMGDTIRGESVTFEARVLNLDRARAARPGAYALFVIRDGRPFDAAPIPQGEDEFTHRFESAGPGRYRLQVQRTATGLGSIEAISTPIWHERRRGRGRGQGKGGRWRPTCPNRIAGTSGKDRLKGTKAGDKISARRGGDRVLARAGEDCARGGKGRDKIGGGGSRDLLRGGKGRDRLRARDGNRDRVRCGRGRDSARVDRRDQARGCERLVRGRRS
jgi:hemolysin type calcium-binding protein